MNSIYLYHAVQALIKTCKGTFFIFFVTPFAFAYNQSNSSFASTKINFELRGTVVAVTCKVDTPDQDKYVDLRSWDIKKLVNPPYVTKSIPFKIKITGCPDTNVSISFTGAKDNSNTELLALDSDSTASGVGIEILDTLNKRLPMNNNSKYVRTSEHGDAVISFSARYVATGKPEPGSANAVSEFTLTYD